MGFSETVTHRRRLIRSAVAIASVRSMRADAHSSATGDGRCEAGLPEHPVEDRRQYGGADRRADPLGGLQAAAGRAGHPHGDVLERQRDVG